MKENIKEFYTDYETAVRWFQNNYVICDVSKIDDTIEDNMRFAERDEDGDYITIYQYFITDASKDEVKYLERTFGLLFTYSNLLSCFVLCVPHYGTRWTYVPCRVKTQGWIECNKDKEYDR